MNKDVVGLDEDLKEQVLQLVASGYTRPEVAETLGLSLYRLTYACDPKSDLYDEDFAASYKKLTKPQGEHEIALAERLETAAIHRALKGSDRLMVALLTIYHPKWEIHRPQPANKIDINVDEIRVLMQNASSDTLRQLVADYEQRKQITAGDVVV